LEKRFAVDGGIVKREISNTIPTTLMHKTIATDINDKRNRLITLTGIFCV
jgi:hypothetical protein